MEAKEAIEVIKVNYPPGNYTRLREALDLSMNILQQIANGSYLINDNFDVSCPDCDCRFSIGRGLDE